MLPRRQSVVPGGQFGWLAAVTETLFLKARIASETTLANAALALHPANEVQPGMTAAAVPTRIAACSLPGARPFGTLRRGPLVAPDASGAVGVAASEPRISIVAGP